MRLICGGSGQGKTTFIYDELISESVRHEDRRYFLIVPEQASSFYEKELIKRHPRHGALNIEILSFNRLAYRIIDELNVDLKDVLDDIGKAMLLRKVVYDNKSELKIYHRMNNRAGFIDQLKSIISEFYQYEIFDGDLRAVLNEDIDDYLKYKLHDLILLYHSFVKEIEGRYQVAETLPDFLAKLTPKSQLLHDSIFYFDGFTGFTPNQYVFISELMKVVKDITFSVTISNNAFTKEGSSDMFRLSVDMIDKLKTTYNSSRPGEEIKTINLDYREGSYRQYGKPDLLALESTLFRRRMPIPSGIIVSNVKGYEAVSTRAEVNAVARDIRDYIDNHNLRYRDIAIISPDLDEYKNIIKETFIDYEIPCFIDKKEDIINNPFIEGLKVSIDIALKGRSGFNKDSVERLLQTKVTNLTDDEVYDLRNYLIETDSYRYNYFINGFTRVPKYLWNNDKDDRNRALKEERKKILLNRVNDIRLKLVSPLNPIINAVKSKDNKLIIEEIYNYTVALSYQQRLEEYAESIKDKDVNQYSLWMRIYPSIISLLDKLYNLIKDYNSISGDELNEIMCEGLDEIAIGSTPSTFDQVLVGDLFRTRVDNVKVMFMIGLNDNVLPMSNSSTNLLNDKDRNAFKSTSLNLAPDRIDKIYQERFYLYLMATKPSDKLIFSYSRMNSEGSSMSPCYFVKEIKRVLNDVRIEVVDKEVYLCSKSTLYRSTVEELVSYENGDVSSSPLNTMLKYIKEYESDLLYKLNQAYSYKNFVAPISRDLVNRLFGKDLYLSVSRLEKYEECPFKYFINYGLSVKEPYDYSFQSNDYGNLFHRILEIYGSRIMDLGISYSELGYEEHIRISDEAINQAFLELDYSFDESSRLHFHEDIIRDIAKDNIDVVAWQNKRSEFVPIGFEMSFSKHGDLNSPVITLDGGRNITLTGFIDRVDECIDGDKKYLRVIDYKSGHTIFDLTKIYYGLQLQLLTYLNVLKSDGLGDVKAAYYYHIDKPIVEGTLDDEINYDILLKRHDYYKSYLDKFKLNGFGEGSSNVVSKLEIHEPSGTLDTINVAYKKDGTFTSKSAVYSADDIESLLKYQEYKLKKIADDMFKGDISISPYILSKKTPCDYCNYKDICGVKKSDAGIFRRLGPKTIDDIKEVLNDEEM